MAPIYSSLTLSDVDRIENYTPFPGNKPKIFIFSEHNTFLDVIIFLPSSFRFSHFWNRTHIRNGSHLGDHRNEFPTSCEVHQQERKHRFLYLFCTWDQYSWTQGTAFRQEIQPHCSPLSTSMCYSRVHFFSNENCTKILPGREWRLRLNRNTPNNFKLFFCKYCHCSLPGQENLNQHIKTTEHKTSFKNFGTKPEKSEASDEKVE